LLNSQEGKVRVLVVGGGIGGLAAALALREAGFGVHVYEQARVLREVGAGVGIGPNASRVLHRLGPAGALGAVGVLPLSLDARDWQSGEVLSRLPVRAEAVRRWGAPFYNLHRADLHGALRVALGDEHLSLDARCVAVEESDVDVRIGFADGHEARGDVLVGADGIHSVVRAYVAGPDRPVWSRQVAWRGLAAGDVGREVGLEVRQHSFWGPRKQFVTYYVSSGRLVNWVCNAQTDDDWQEESWSARGDRDELLARCEGWHHQVRRLIEGTDEVYKWALFDRPPLDSWTRGRVTLLGDAAHPMLPYRAQGASLSIEDAAVLALCLAASRDEPESALQTYAVVRRDRADAIQAASRDQGRTAHLDDPEQVRARNERMRANPDVFRAGWDWIWSYDAERALIERTATGGD
jgi:salicylate hydroxylase